MKNFIALVEKIDVEKALKGAAILIFIFKMVEIILSVIMPAFRLNSGVPNVSWIIGMIMGLTVQGALALFHPLVLLALAEIIRLKKITVANTKGGM